MANYTILLIDYEPRSIERFREPLIGAGYVVEIATDGLSGIEAFHRLSPDMVLVEAMIPKKHGFEVCQELKRTPHGRRTPVLITTGVYKGRKYRTQALHIYGCDEYIEKPIAPEQLLEIVGKFLAPGAPGASPKATEASRVAPETGADRGVDHGVGHDADAIAKNPSSPKLRAREAPSAKPDSVPEAVAKDDAEDEITARLDALLSGGDSPTSMTVRPATAAVVATIEGDPFGQMRAELNSEFGDLSTPLAFETAPPLEPMPEPIPSDQVVSPSVLEALPVPEPGIQIASSQPSAQLATDERPDQSIEVGAKRPRKNKKAERQGKGRSPQVAPVSQVSQVPQVAQAAHVTQAAPSPGLVVPRTNEPSVPAFEVALPRGTLVESELESAARRRSVPLWVWATVGVVAIVALYFVFSRGDSTPADAGPTPTRSVAAPSPVASAPPVASTPTEESARTSEPPSLPSEKSKLVLNAVSSPATQKPPKPSATPPPASSAAKPTVASGPVPNPDPTPPVDAAPASTAPDKVEASPVVQPPAEVAPDLDPHIAGVETVPDPTLSAPATTVGRGALIPIDAADTMPVTVFRRAPVYSMQAKQLRLAGTVVMNVLINEQGTVDQVVLVHGVPGADVNDSAISAAKTWTYRPATKNGVPVKVWKSEQIIFKP